MRGGGAGLLSTSGLICGPDTFVPPRLPRKRPHWLDAKAGAKVRSEENSGALVSFFDASWREIEGFKRCIERFLHIIPINMLRIAQVGVD